MRYQSGGAFRRALEVRLRDNSLSSGLPLTRLRKMVAFDRLLVRLVQSQPGQWVVKGGLALQLRLGDQARTTKDIDLLFLSDPGDILDRLQMAATLEVGDWFSFEIGYPTGFPIQKAGGIRHPVHSLLDGRTFERFHVDVGVGDPLIEAVDYLVAPDLLSFAEIDPVVIPCYPITQQLAEKFHAYARPHVSGESSRIKDFVDIMLLVQMSQVSAQKLSTAIQATFRKAGNQSVPRRIPSPPRTWTRGFSRVAAEAGFTEYDLQSAYARLRQFFDPILAGDAGDMSWSPESWSWA